MIVYDINSYPSYLGIEIWRELINDGVVLFDSTKGVQPLKVDDNLALIDINDMTPEQEIEIADIVNKINERYRETAERDRNIAQQNSIRLVKYLQALRTGEDITPYLKPQKNENT